jgi:hypothetical protein
MADMMTCEVTNKAKRFDRTYNDKPSPRVIPHIEIVCHLDNGEKRTIKITQSVTGDSLVISADGDLAINPISRGSIELPIKGRR